MLCVQRQFSACSLIAGAKRHLAIAATVTLSITPLFAQAKEDTMQAPSALMQAYGTLDDATPVNKVTLTNSHGIEIDVISYGGIITRLETPDRNGESGNIVLGMDNLEDYVESNPYFGAIIGRYGNRIAKGRREQEYKLFFSICISYIMV